MNRIRAASASLATILACLPLLAARAQGIEGGVDTTVRPGDDFFAWANGGWLRSTEIPAGKARWGIREELAALTRRQLDGLIADARTAPAGTAARKVADFHAAWLNEAAIEARGLMPLRPFLESIDRINDRGALTRALGRSVRADVDPLNWGVYQSASLLGLSVEEGINGEKANVAFLLQGGLGLPDRESYISADARMQALRTRYQAYIGRMLALAGCDRAEPRAAAVMDLETAIARTQATLGAESNDTNADTVWTRADFARQAPGMDWSAFFEAAGLARQQAFVPWQPGAVRGVAALVGSEPLDAWKDYLRFHLLDASADVLPRAIADEAAAMHGTSPRATRALEATQLAMSDAIGRMYADRYMPAEQKARVQAIVENVRAAFVRRIERVTWLTPASRAIALEKLRTLYLGVGYPEHWQDYSDLAVDPQDAFGNNQRVAARNLRQAQARLGQPVDTHDWWIAPQTVGAVLTFQLNAYNFSAALMQPPKFDPAASDAAVYGTIGAIFGHDITHYVDILGADFDTAGAERHWWSAGELAAFHAMALPLVNQFSSYHPFPDVAVNGVNSERENVADLGGLAAAFDAYRLAHAASRAGDREFFIAWARAWRVRMRDDALRTYAATNDHAPDMYRVDTVRNLDAWYDAFDVRPGQRLYLEPSARARVW